MAATTANARAFAPDEENGLDSRTPPRAHWEAFLRAGRVRPAAALVSEIEGKRGRQRHVNARIGMAVSYRVFTTAAFNRGLRELAKSEELLK